MTGSAVTAAADREFQPGLAGERNNAGDVARILCPNDDRWPAVNPAIEDGARFIVPGVARSDYLAIEFGT
jgi:hypothetical protein